MKKGFTLIELLGVMVVLGIIALIITPSVAGIIKDSEEKTYNKQVDMIENAAKEWGIENIDFLPDEDSGKTKVIDLNKLVSSGKIQNSTILDPRTKEEMSGCVTVKYNSEYNQYEYKYNEDENYCIELSKICRPVTEATVGNVPAGSFAYGDEYICDVGDGVARTFFVLEDGDNITLTKGDFTQVHYETDNVGTAGEGEVALIMSENIGESAWCEDTSDASCNGEPAISTLESLTSNWMADVNLPTYAQIVSANSGKDSDLPTWMRINISSGGYWLSTVKKDSFFYEAPAPFAVIEFNNYYLEYYNSDQIFDIRPVITISKNQIG